MDVLARHLKHTDQAVPHVSRVDNKMSSLIANDADGRGVILVPHLTVNAEKEGYDVVNIHDRDAVGGNFGRESLDEGDEINPGFFALYGGIMNIPGDIRRILELDKHRG